MKYLLFISYSSGLNHNTVYETLTILHESIEQLIEDEELNIEEEKLLSVFELEKHLKKNDDIFQYLSNGTWFHIQELSERNYIRDEISQEISV